jgi:nucleotide-binding universal stress UspA family protein
MDRMVVGIDGSTNSEQALGWALDRAAPRHARVEAVHTWQVFASGTIHGIAASDHEQLEHAAHVVLDGSVQRVVPDHPPVPVEQVVVPGPAAAALLEQSRDADLLVVGSRGRGGFSGLLLGSVSQQVVQHAPVPVVVVPEGGTAAVKGRIVVGVDDSRGARTALAWALRWAEREQAEVDVVLAYDSQLAWIDVDSDYEAQWLENARTKAEATLRRIVDDTVTGEEQIAVHQVVEEGAPAQVLLDRAKDADLVVVGTRGRGGFAGLLLGSVSQRCAQHSPCPVAVVPEPV